MTQERSDPDDLVQRIAAEERRARRGKLTIFFGAAPGVGKTYAMLEAAQREVEQEKRDVVVGVLETHGRYETGALLLGLEILPRREVSHRNIVLSELDLDAVLKRRPGIVLIDELAHTNAPGSRHTKRWQDVEEVLDAGIDVYTTLNVQHLESLNDVVARITGVVVRETVPDAIVEQATLVQLIDLPPDLLIERLHEGKIYRGAQVAEAAEHFFQKGNLIALRELALRRTADRVDADMHVWQAAHSAEAVQTTRERILVGVSASPASSRLLRAARRMAGSLHAPWIAVYIETPASLRLSAKERERLAENLRLADQLGAETLTLSGDSAPEEMVRYATKRCVTKMVVGKPTHARWKDLLRPSFLDVVVRTSGDIDVQVISGEVPSAPARPPGDAPAVGRPRPRAYMASALVIALATGASWEVFGLHELADVVMVLLLGIVLVAMRFGFGPSILAAVLAVLSFDFFFIPPYFTFAVSDLRHILTFAIMFLVAVVISTLTERLRAQGVAVREREQRTASLYAMSRELAGAAGTDALLRVAVRHVADVFACKVAILLPDESGSLVSATTGDATFVPGEKDAGVAEWVWTHDRVAGHSTDTLPAALAFFAPLRAGKARVGVLGILPDDSRPFSVASQRDLLETFTSQVAAAIERAQLSKAAEHARVQVETEQLKNSLLSSVSHDLRTPLAVITGCAATLSEQGLDEPTRKELADTIQEESHRLNILVRNLLDMTRLQGGALRVKKEWQDLEEVLGAALTRLEERLANRTVNTNLPASLPMAPFDPILIEQVFINLLENVIKYAPEGTPIDISARRDGDAIEVSVADRGPGVSAADRERVFEKFYRGGEAPGGVGLGLPICRGIVTAHGGRLWVEAREGGGADFRFTIPLEGGAPPIVPDEGPSIRAEVAS